MTQARLRRAVDLVGAMRSSQPVLRRRLGAMLAVVASVYVGSTAMVVSSASLPVLLAGWEPVVITTESARPALSPGDLVLFDELHVAETVDEGSVVRFRDPDNPAHTVVDRVAGRQDDTYVILGDGSPTRRGAAVGRDAILGVDRLSLPIVGLPVVWLEDGDLAPFAMWAISIVGATAFLVHRWQRRALRPRRRGGRAGDVADSAIRRLRAGVGVLVIVQLAVDDSPLRSGADAVAAVAVVVALGTINVASMRAWRPRIRRYLELAVDVVVALLIAAPAGSGSLLWLALLLPIAEATIRARVVGAAVAWMSLALASVVLRTATAPDGDTVADQLGGLVEQLGVLLVATLFGAFLTEKLLVGIVSQRDAVQRSELLHVVAEAGQRVSTVDLELMTTVLETTESLGFDRCDVVVRSDEAWRVVGASSGGTSRPAATTAAGGVLGTRLPSRAEVDDADSHAAPALRRLGLARVIVLRLSTSPLAALRVGVASGRRASSEQLEALDLLVGQARVALQNELLVAELRSTRQALEKQALTDSLTGLPNRAAFHRHLGERNTDEHDGGRVAVLFCDLDGFKAVNDEMGHDAGDALLVEVSRRLTGLVSEDDLVARLGGDEFVVVAAGRDSGQLDHLASEIVQAVGVPVPIGDSVAVVGTSVGVAEAEPGLDDDEVVRRADAAMYAVKSTGKRSWRRFDDSLEAAPRRSVQLRSDILAAIRRDELRLEYQPVVSARPGPLRIVLAEALLRWHHPDFGRIGPHDTLAAAIDAGNRDEVEEWVLRKACTDAARWQVPSGPPVPVAVNLSPSQLRRRELVQLVSTTLAGTGLPAECLVLELSEQATIDHRDVLASLDELRARGVSLALDDFGTGEASLTTLRSVELDVLKLDKSFVDRCESVETERKILGAIATLAQGLGLIVVAEGVERRQQLEIVRSFDIELVQGYIAFRPLVVEELSAALERQRSAPVLARTPVSTASADTLIDRP